MLVRETKFQPFDSFLLPRHAGDLVLAERGFVFHTKALGPLSSDKPDSDDSSPPRPEASTSIASTLCGGSLIFRLGEIPNRGGGSISLFSCHEKQATKEGADLW